MDYMLALPGNENVRSINPLVGETNDGGLNDIRGRHITSKDVANAIRGASTGAVEEGVVGAGVGTTAFGFKGGIGTSSRRLPDPSGGYTVGVLVQTNFGGVLTINGAPVGEELGQYYMRSQIEGAGAGDGGVDNADGSIMIVVGTDAPIENRNLKRLAARAMMGLGRTGSASTNGSGDFVIAFSTAREPEQLLGNNRMSPLFLAAIEATEEAIYNSLFRATTTTGNGRTVEALPLERTLEIMRKYGAIR